MKNRRKTRRLTYLIHKYDTHGRFRDINHLNDQIDIYSKVLTSVRCKELHDAYVEIKKLSIELNVDMNEYYKIAIQERKKINDSYDSRQVNNLKETRDNKGIYVGSGNSNRNKIRYPKKNKSKKVWITFYKMFPSRAKIDEFDGETSTRMK